MRCLCAHVLPGVPVRQWVLTAPHEARRVLALRPDALTAQGRIFVEGIARWQKRVASAGGETGAVTFVQRFNSTLGCFVHFHVIVPDGVFRADDAGAVVFREGPAPTRADIADVAARVEKRMRRWLRRRALLDERAAKDRSNDAPERSPLEACMQLSFFLSSEAPICGSREMARQRRERERERKLASAQPARARGWRKRRGSTGMRASPCARIEWCQLLRRIYLLDVLACPCGGRRAIVADIPASEVVVAILAHLGLPPFAPPLARARSPGFDFTSVATARAGADSAGGILVQGTF